MDYKSIYHLKTMWKFFILCSLMYACDTNIQNPNLEKQHGETAIENNTILNPTGNTIASRFNPPQGFNRIVYDENSFATFLRKQTLHPHGKKVLLYNGNEKGNQQAHIAVLKVDVGKEDLQQCADAVMRLRAEYLYANKKYQELHFNFTNGFCAAYDTWQKGNAIKINGNKVTWYSSTSADNSYTSFRQYLKQVFNYAGTASLEKELKTKTLKDIEVGDVFIYGGHPGHAVLVADVVQNAQGEKAFLLLQSYMPAQEIHILKNPAHADNNPWYFVSKINNVIETPEWTFYEHQLKRF